MDNRKILHLDLDAFFCAVEEKYDPSLKGKAFAVGGSPTGRGVVTSCSYAARAYGVRSAMPMGQALQLCPGLLAVSSNRGKYSENSKLVMKVLWEFSDLVEQISIDEAFIDLKNSTEDLKFTAKKIQSKIFKNTSLPSSIGGASNKLVSKIANNVGKISVKTKDYPRSINIIPPGKEEEFLAPLPTIALWGVGPKSSLAMERLGIYTIGDIADYPLFDLVKHFGSHGYSLSKRSKGIDNSPLSIHRDRKSVSHENTFSSDLLDKNKILSTLRKQAAKVSKVLVNKNLKGNTVKIKFRYSDFTTLSRQITVPDTIDQTEDIFSIGKKLFLDNWKNNFPIRLIGIGVTNFVSSDSQLSLWDAEQKMKEAELSNLVDQINLKYGNKSIKIGSENE